MNTLQNPRLPKGSNSLLQRAGLASVALITFGCSSSSPGIVSLESNNSSNKGHQALIEAGIDPKNHVDPVTTTWEDCPNGDLTLPYATNVSAYTFLGSRLGGFVEIGSTGGRFLEQEGLIDGGDSDENVDATITEYYDREENLVAFCGPSVGIREEHGVVGPEEGTIVVIPVNEDCQPARDVGLMECSFAPIVYLNN